MCIRFCAHLDTEVARMLIVSSEHLLLLLFHSTGTVGASAASQPLPSSLVLQISLEELREAAAALRCCTVLGGVTSWEHQDQGKGRAKASPWLKSQTADVSLLQGPFWHEPHWHYQAVTVLKQNSLSRREA